MPKPKNYLKTPTAPSFEEFIFNWAATISPTYGMKDPEKAYERLCDCLFAMCVEFDTLNSRWEKEFEKREDHIMDKFFALRDAIDKGKMDDIEVKTRELVANIKANQ